MGKISTRTILYLLPYLLLLSLGIWYRIHYTSIALLNADSCSYLLPPCCRQLTGEWHKAYRPMQYLLFIYATLSKSYSLKYTIIAQKALGIAGAGFLVGAWLMFLSHIRNNTFLLNLAGYFMLAIYISSPVLMNYEVNVGPESFCIFIMCLLIFCLSGVFVFEIISAKGKLFIMSAAFINLYLSNPMPKCVFDTILLAALLVWLVVRKNSLSVRSKAYILILPFLLYVFTVMIPEYTHKIDVPSDDRVYIEFEQMVYSHFDLLARDKSNFEIPPLLQDSLIHCFHDSKSKSLIGFNSDKLMWGAAANMIGDYYNHNEDSIGAFYRKMDYKLVTKYPLALSKQILKQIAAFYIPNSTIHKDLYCDRDMYAMYTFTREKSLRADLNFSDILNFRCTNKNYTPLRQDIFSSQYPSTLKATGVNDFSPIPLLLGEHFFFYAYFDYIFFAVMIIFFFAKYQKGAFFKWDIVTLLYLYIAIYVITIAIVHSFDVGRFIITIYPFILITTFLAFASICTRSHLLDNEQSDN